MKWKNVCLSQSDVCRNCGLAMLVQLNCSLKGIEQSREQPNLKGKDLGFQVEDRTMVEREVFYALMSSLNH